MPRFLVLARDSFDWGSLQPEELEKAFGEYVSYDQQVGETGKLLGGEKLADDGRVLRSDGAGGIDVAEGPYVESKDVLGGYMMLEADDYDQAVEIAKTHPHLQFGNIEIRQIDDMGM